MDATMSLIDHPAPERAMVGRAVIAGTLAAPLAFVAGSVAGGVDDGWSALLGVVVVAANFAVHGLSLAWAAAISIVLLQVVALTGFVARMGIILGVLVLLDRTVFFSSVVFGFAAVAATLGLLGYEARLVARGLGGGLRIPADPAAAAAAEALRAREDAAR
jgi:hypothetical protein